jgi:predicted ester cyclase
MQETITPPGVLALSRANMENYFKTHDVKYVHEDAVFTNMSTGDEARGREAIAILLNYIYHVAFDARAVTVNSIITEDKAMIEGFFRGKHIGEFAGIPATNKEVNVPLCVTYELEDGLIRHARIYMLSEVMMKQLKGSN